MASATPIPGGSIGCARTLGCIDRIFAQNRAADTATVLGVVMLGGFVCGIAAVDDVRRRAVRCVAAFVIWGVASGGHRGVVA